MAVLLHQQMFLLQEFAITTGKIIKNGVKQMSCGKKKGSKPTKKGK